MEFRTLSKRVAEVLGGATRIAEPAAPASERSQVAAMPFDAANYEQVSDDGTLQNWIDRIYEFGYVAVDTETTGLNEMAAELVGISLAVEPGKACYIPLTHKANRADDLFGSDDMAEGQMRPKRR